MTVSAINPPQMRGINTVLMSDGREVHLDDITTAAEGQTILDDLDAAIINIELQVDAARDGASPNDPEWRRRAETALKRKRRIRPRMQQRIGELRKAERLAQVQAAAKAVPGDVQRKAFVIAAADMLDDELVTEIWARAREIRPAAFAEGSA
ncbi:hypothetical protein [Methylobacterium sp. yr668]|uniref:hypothetical protein n=1 Tax=Methylobacterium sp. yr668 TaxID=1761801 RepID=UPI0008E91DD7|nr:hypothetical protein [Methylobacterium sp. yr668]SFT11041.1 hypothetical protein SAMN04487845_116116 [Methylobacterium sp. yr668]